MRSLVFLFSGKEVMKKFFLTVLCIQLMVPAVSATETKFYLSEARKAAQTGQIDFAFMNYRSLLREQPESSDKLQALFAMGEYYFLQTDFLQAELFFKEYLQGSRDPNGCLFAKFYLWKMAGAGHDKYLTSQLVKELKMPKAHTFIFRDSEEYIYKSPLNRKHLAVYFIDKIEFYVEGNLLAQVSY